MAKPRPKRFIVEGQDDKGAVIHLMDQHTRWPSDPDQWPVHVEIGGSAEEILVPESLSTELKSSELKCLGIMIDADDVFESRWTSLQGFCAKHFDAVPKKLPKEGLILAGKDGLRFGAWFMPDNTSAGALENFCALMVPAAGAKVWSHTESAFDEAIKLGAPCKPAHKTKGHIHTWLACQEPPGERIGSAIRAKILDPKATCCTPFVQWFKKLFEL